jgi:hypothetical protein
MAMGVIGGVLSSTFLTLLVVPVFYLTVEGLKGWLGRWFWGSGRRARRAPWQAADAAPAGSRAPDAPAAR